MELEFGLGALPLSLFENALVLVCFNRVTRVIVNPNRSIMCPRLRCLAVPNGTRDGIRPIVPVGQIAAHRKSDRRRVYLCAGGLRKRA